MSIPSRNCSSPKRTVSGTERHVGCSAAGSGMSAVESSTIAVFSAVMRPSLERPPGIAVRCRSPASRRSRSSVWTCMFAIATRSIAPMTTAIEIASPGSSVWTCTFTSGASPTTSRQSPISSSARSRASRSTASPSTRNAVQ